MVDGPHAVGGEELGDEAGHRDAVLEHVGDARRRADVVLEHLPRAVAVAHEVAAGDVAVDAARRADAVDGAGEVRAAGDEAPRDDALADDLAPVVDVVDEVVQRADALREALLDGAPLGARTGSAGRGRAGTGARGSARPRPTVSKVMPCCMKIASRRRPASPRPAGPRRSSAAISGAATVARAPVVVEQLVVERRPRRVRGLGRGAGGLGGHHPHHRGSAARRGFDVWRKMAPGVWTTGTTAPVASGRWTPMPRASPGCGPPARSARRSRRSSASSRRRSCASWRSARCCRSCRATSPRSSAPATSPSASSSGRSRSPRSSGGRSAAGSPTGTGARRSTRRAWRSASLAGLLLFAPVRRPGPHLRPPRRRARRRLGLHRGRHLDRRPRARGAPRPDDRDVRPGDLGRADVRLGHRRGHVRARRLRGRLGLRRARAARGPARRAARPGGAADRAARQRGARRGRARHRRSRPGGAPPAPAPAPLDPARGRAARDRRSRSRTSATARWPASSCCCSTSAASATAPRRSPSSPASVVVSRLVLGRLPDLLGARRTALGAGLVQGLGLIAVGAAQSLPGGARRRRAHGRGHVAAVPLARAARRRPRGPGAPRRGDGRVHRVLRPRRRARRAVRRARRVVDAASTRPPSTSAGRCCLAGALLGWFSTRGIRPGAGARMTPHPRDLPSRAAGRAASSTTAPRAAGSASSRSGCPPSAPSRRGRSATTRRSSSSAATRTSSEQDRFPYLTAEIALLREWLPGGRPVLGVCLGAQLLAEAAGGRVVRAEQRELGWLDVELLPAAGGRPASSASRPARVTALQWHSYAVEPPPGAVDARAQPRLHRRRSGSARAWGVQFHPEVDRAILDVLARRPGPRRPAAGARRGGARGGRRASTWTRGTPSAVSCSARFLTQAG